MQKSTSTTLIAFLAGIVVAGGTAYVVSGTRHRDTSQPAQQVAPVQAPAVPAVQPPTAPDNATPAQTKPIEPQQQPEARPAVEPKSAVEDRASARRKRRPAVERRIQQPQPQQSSEAASAAQPTQAELAQNAGPQNQTGAPDQQNSSLPSQNQIGQAEQNGTSPPNAALNPPPGTPTAPPPPRTPQTVTIAAGTSLPVRINETISTDTNYSGDAFTATLEKPLVVNGFIIADRGARITGKIVQAEKAGRVKGVADLQLALTKLHTTDGQSVDIVTTPWDKRGAGSKKRDTAEMAGGAALGAIIGAIAGGGKGAAIGAGTGGAAGTGVVLTQRGKSATIPSETRLTFTLDSPVTITERL